MEWLRYTSVPHHHNYMVPYIVCLMYVHRLDVDFAASLGRWTSVCVHYRVVYIRLLSVEYKSTLLGGTGVHLLWRHDGWYPPWHWTVSDPQRGTELSMTPNVALNCQWPPTWHWTDSDPQRGTELTVIECLHSSIIDMVAIYAHHCSCFFPNIIHYLLFNVSVVND